MYLANDYPLLSAFWTMLWFFLWVMWFFLLFKVVFDIFRDDALSGWGKAGWLVFVIVLPFLGVFVYLIARGKDMGRRDVEHARAQKQMFDSYVRETAGGGTSSADELAKLAEMRTRGDITQEEFQQAKALVLSGGSPTGDAARVSTPGPR
ncbi:SHOCT domain-containing protein [Streptomyces sp. 142MFCol3.1]|uniref:SHOCT domain-containing protein n=1 Tax=Streptomyces sp. 142MFCol3.1 TaxID=1172179 RepID=UPI0004029916|nr:SHOCT domain-containing protein [Streptomyces sp. 142MFCol3.1]